MKFLSIPYISHCTIAVFLCQFHFTAANRTLRAWTANMSGTFGEGHVNRISISKSAYGSGSHGSGEL